jgi:hypothetical protein
MSPHPEEPRSGVSKDEAAVLEQTNDGLADAEFAAPLPD